MANLDALRLLNDYVTNDLAVEWQRKTSFETRAFAIVTANLASSTLLLALSDRAGLLTRISSSSGRGLAIVAMIAGLASVMTSLLSVRPRAQKSLPVVELESVLSGILRGAKPEEVLSATVDARLGILDTIVKANDARGRWIATAYILLAVEATVLLASIIVSALGWNIQICP